MEGARLVHGCIGGLFAKNYQLPEFSWDKENKPKPKPYTEDEINAMRREAQAFADRLNKKK